MESKISLGLCTLTSRLIIALEYKGQIYSYNRKIFAQETALFPAIKNLLPLGKSIADIKQVSALKGPGRFTGIRIGLTVAAVLNALSAAKVYTATVFDILACQAADSKAFKKAFPNGGKVFVLLHAFRDEYFLASYNISAPSALPEAADKALWIKDKELKLMLSAIKQPFFCIADRVESPDIYQLLPPHALHAPKNISAILAPYLISAPRRYGICDLKPLYLKPAKFETDAKNKAILAAAAKEKAKIC